MIKEKPEYEYEGCPACKSQNTVIRKNKELMYARCIDCKSKGPDIYFNQCTIYFNQCTSKYDLYPTYSKVFKMAVARSYAFWRKKHEREVKDLKELFFTPDEETINFELNNLYL